MKEKQYSQRSLFFNTLLFGLLFAILHIVLERCMAFASSDVALSYLTRPLNIAITLCDAVCFFIVYAFAILAVSRFGAKASSATLLLLFAISLAKHLGNWATFLITENISSAIDIRLSAMTTASSVFIEWLQNAALVVLCLILLSPKRTLENPVKITSLSVCGMMVLLNVLSRIALDVEYGAPTSTAEVWVMVAYYLFDILLYGVVGYFIMKGLLRQKHSEPLSEE